MRWAPYAVRTAALGMLLATAGVLVAEAPAHACKCVNTTTAEDAAETKPRRRRPRAAAEKTETAAVTLTSDGEAAPAKPRRRRSRAAAAAETTEG